MKFKNPHCATSCYRLQKPGAYNNKSQGKTLDSSTRSTSSQFWEKWVDENCSIFPINTTLKQNCQSVRPKIVRRGEKKKEESEGEKRPAIYPLFLYWKIWREKRTTSWALGHIKNPDVHTAQKKSPNNLSWLATEVCSRTSRTDELLGKSQIMRLTQSTDSFPWHGKCLSVYVLSIQTHLFFFFVSCESRACLKISREKELLGNFLFFLAVDGITTHHI